MNEELNISEKLEIKLEPANEADANKKEYRVTAETGIFKREQLWNKGDIILLDAATAERFKQLGEVEDV